MKKACVIGWPIKHSRSPLIHNYWLRQYGIDGHYERVAVDPKDLNSFIKNLEHAGYRGCNVTIPHKEAAIAAVDCVDVSVSETGSLNTIYLNGKQICGTSTDGDGFLRNVLSHHPDFDFRGKNIFMIGAGGSAKAICQRLLRDNVAGIFISNRTFSRAKELQKMFGNKINPIQQEDMQELLSKSDMLINTTSQGMAGQPVLNIDLKYLPARALVADIVYVPLKTALIRQAESLGLKTVPGLGMLLHQAVEGFHRWFGIQPTVTPELYDLIASDILAEHPE